MYIESGTFEYAFLLILTIILLLFKIVATGIILKLVLEKRKKVGKLQVDFLFCVLIFFIALLVSRIFLMLFDFHYTHFDTTLQHLWPAAFCWQLAYFIFFLAAAFFVFILDKKAFEFRLKGSIAYIITGLAFVLLLYPVRTAEDFIFITYLLLVAMGFSFSLVIFFAYMGRNAPKGSNLRKFSYSALIGVIFFAIGSNAVNPGILVPLLDAFGDAILLYLWLITLSFKLVSFGLWTYAAVKFDV